jgi:hypothetical protein
MTLGCCWDYLLLPGLSWCLFWVGPAHNPHQPPTLIVIDLTHPQAFHHQPSPQHQQSAPPAPRQGKRQLLRTRAGSFQPWRRCPGTPPVLLPASHRSTHSPGARPQQPIKMRGREPVPIGDLAEYSVPGLQGKRHLHLAQPGLPYLQLPIR